MTEVVYILWICINASEYKCSSFCNSWISCSVTLLELVGDWILIHRLYVLLYSLYDKVKQWSYFLTRSCDEVVYLIEVVQWGRAIRLWSDFVTRSYNYVMHWDISRSCDDVMYLGHVLRSCSEIMWKILYQGCLMRSFDEVIWWSYVSRSYIGVMYWDHTRSCIEVV